MSWFTEIAGKAEDLLNRVDKTAASALQSKQRSSSYGPATEEVAYGGYSPERPSTSYSLHTDNSFRPSPLRSPVVAIKSAKKSQPLQSTFESDEKLMEFLNSHEPLSYVPSNKLIKSKENDEPSVSNVTSVVQSVSKTVEDVVCTEEKLQTSSKPEQNEVSQNSETLPAETSPSDSTDANTSVPSVTISMEDDVTVPNSVEDKSGDSDDTHSVPSDETPASSSDSYDTHSLKEELLLAVKRAEHAESEMKRMQKKLDHWNSQISGNDRQVRELQERETDLIATIDAKDSQLAVLKVRLQEADQELLTKKNIVEELKKENERIVKEHEDAALCQNQMLDSLRQKLQQTENDLSKEKESYFGLQTEHMQRMSKLEEEQKHLAENFTNLQKKWSEMKEKNKELSSQLKTANANLENVLQEYVDYKQKAQRILQSKEKLILTLKDCNGDVEHQDNKEGAYALLLAETEDLKQERDALREELRRVTEMTESYKTEIQELEKMAQNDSNTARELLRNLEEQFNQEKLYKEELELLNNQLKDELKFLREDLARTKANFQSRIQDRDTEIEKLRRQLMAKSLSTASQDELESRLHALTENLIQKQTVVEALSTEKNSLVLQLERLEQQLKETQMYGSQHHTVVGVSNNEPDRKFKQNVFVENPFDNSLTRRVKRMYGSIDAFSIRLGVFFRRYPVARVFIIVYMLLLHLWVMVVLLTYQPEIHNQHDTKSVQL